MRFRPGPLPRPARPRLAAALLALGLASAAGCERRVEEPVGPAGPSRPGWVGDGAAAGTSKAQGKPGGGRCIRPTTDLPKRKVVGPVPAPDCPADPTGPPQLRTAKVSFPEAKAPDLLAEIAETDMQRTRGLMYRKSMPENQGMIFVFEDRRNHTFWMRNTCIPLDMLFIDNDGTIVGIEENTTMMSDNTFQVGCPSTYVLEVNAGWTRKNGVVAGQKVSFEGI